MVYDGQSAFVTARAFNTGTFMKYFLIGYAILVAVMSLVTFVVYWWDKRAAQRGGRRVSERRLHLLSLLGGWPGAIAGQQLLRHKTQKLSFRIVFWCVLVAHLTAVGGVIYLLW